MCYEEGMVVVNIRTLVWYRQCEWVTLVFFCGGEDGYTLVESLVAYGES